MKYTVDSKRLTKTLYAYFERVYGANTLDKLNIEEMILEEIGRQLKGDT